MSQQVQLKGLPGRGIAILRHIVGLSQLQLSQRVNLSPGIIAHIELGTRQLCDVHVPRFAAALGCSERLVILARGDSLDPDKEFSVGIELADLFRRNTARPDCLAVHGRWVPAKRRKKYPRDLRFLARIRRKRALKRLRNATPSAGAADAELAEREDTCSRSRQARRGAVA